MTKPEILCYWGERMQQLLDFHEACRRKHGAKLPEKISRRLKKEARLRETGDRQGQLTLFPPCAQTIVENVTQRAHAHDAHLLDMMESDKRQFLTLCAYLHDGIDYDVTFFIEWNLSLAHWLDALHRERIRMKILTKT